MKKIIAALSIVATLAAGWAERSTVLRIATITGVFMALEASPALALNCSAFTYTLTNGTTADANQVMSNFNTLMTCANSNLAHNGANSDITSLTGLTTPLSVPQGGTGLGTLTSGQFVIGQGTSTPIGINRFIVQPQGRLTLQTGKPVMTADTTAVSTVYYDCYIGQYVPYFDGSNDQIDPISSCEVSTTMQTSSTGVTNSGGVFDVWWVHSGASRICVVTNGSGGGWASDTGGSNTARGTGYSQLDTTSRGYITNKNALTHCYNGATDYGSVSANQATYLGTLTTTAAGQTGMAFKPAAASGGTNNVLGLWNAYNRARVTAYSRNTATWSYNAAAWRGLNGLSGDRITWVDGLQQSRVEAMVNVEANTSSSSYAVAIDFDSTSASPGGNIGFASGTNAQQAFGYDSTISLGLHFAQGVENGITGTTNVNGTNTVTPLVTVSLSLDM